MFLSLGSKNILTNIDKKTSCPKTQKPAHSNKNPAPINKSILKKKKTLMSLDCRTKSGLAHLETSHHVRDHYLRSCCCCYITLVASDSVRPHRWQPTRLPRPWDSPGKNNGVGYHFLLQCMKVKSQSEVAQSYRILSNPMDCSLPGSSIHRIFQARVLKRGAIAFSVI